MLTDFATTSTLESFFRFASAESDLDSGDVDSPSGWFALVTVDDRTVSEFATIDAEILTLRNNTTMHVCPDGQYLVTINSDGIIWAERDLEYDNAVTLAYAERESDYIAHVWQDDDALS